MADDIYVTIQSEDSTTITTVGETGLTGASGLLSDITDVDTTAKTDGSVLVYKLANSKWTATTILEQQEMNGGFF
jgi:hypothetical protein